MVGALLIWAVVKSNAIEKSKSPEQRDSDLHGAFNRELICPHCATKGHVRTRGIVTKKGISGGKATAAVLTAGVSVLATGLSRKEANTQAKCMKCTSSWNF
jgi:hypothetical protein